MTKAWVMYRINIISQSLISRAANEFRAKTARKIPTSDYNSILKKRITRISILTTRYASIFIAY
jgi:hypothetical protein